MCGIAGIITPGAERFSEHLGRMTASLRHRGPDADGGHEFDHCILGHRRLTIVDLETGDQPMLSPDGRVAITFNGEIYGYRGIRRSLEPTYAFRTASDTEAILALYELHGVDLLEHLPGMFAFAIWDDRSKTLLAARDRFGEKPFFYSWGRDGEFVFASEIKAILASGLVEPEIEGQSLFHFVRRLHVPPDRTIWKNVFTLPPAHRLTLHEGNLTIERYWDLPPPSDPISVEDAITEFRTRFERAVEDQLVADVPVAAFLSGGLDSSTVVAVASQLRPGIRTISFGFGDNRSELPFAREIATRYGTDHVEIEDREIDLAALLVRMAEVYDEPFADSSNIPTFLIAEAARKHAKVVLTGDGGDELLGGYDSWYRPLVEMERWRSRPGAIAAFAGFAARISNRLGFQPPGDIHSSLQGALLSRRHASVHAAHQSQLGYFRDRDLERLGFGSPSRPQGEPPGKVDDAMRADLTEFMPGDILVKIDRASMGHGLELRAPFLDADFASFCIGLPARLKITDSESKWILRRAYENAWTKSVRGRGKQGFGAPVKRWLGRPEVVPIRHRILGDPKHRVWELLPFDVARRLTNGEDIHAWIFLTLGLWAERWMGR